MGPHLESALARVYEQMELEEFLGMRLIGRAGKRVMSAAEKALFEKLHPRRKTRGGKGGEWVEKTSGERAAAVERLHPRPPRGRSGRAHKPITPERERKLRKTVPPDVRHEGLEPAPAPRQKTRKPQLRNEAVSRYEMPLAQRETLPRREGTPSVGVPRTRKGGPRKNEAGVRYGMPRIELPRAPEPKPKVGTARGKQSPPAAHERVRGANWYERQEYKDLLAQHKAKPSPKSRAHVRAVSGLNPEQLERELAGRGKPPVGTERGKGTKLTARERNALPSSDFVFPRRRKYPIDTVERARTAVAYSRRNLGKSDQAKVIDAVKRRYPNVNWEAEAERKRYGKPHKRRRRRMRRTPAPALAMAQAREEQTMGPHLEAALADLQAELEEMDVLGMLKRGGGKLSSLAARMRFEKLHPREPKGRGGKGGEWIVKTGPGYRIGKKGTPEGGKWLPENTRPNRRMPQGTGMPYRTPTKGWRPKVGDVVEVGRGSRRHGRIEHLDSMGKAHLSLSDYGPGLGMWPIEDLWEPGTQAQAPRGKDFDFPPASDWPAHDAGHRLRTGDWKPGQGGSAYVLPYEDSSYYGKGFRPQADWEHYLIDEETGLVMAKGSKADIQKLYRQHMKAIGGKRTANPRYGPRSPGWKNRAKMNAPPSLHRGLLRNPEANKTVFKVLHGQDYSGQWKKRKLREADTVADMPMNMMDGEEQPKFPPKKKGRKRKGKKGQVPPQFRKKQQPERLAEVLDFIEYEAAVAGTLYDTTGLEEKLTMAQRRALPKSAFVFPERAPDVGAYPIHDKKHAIAALHYAKGKKDWARVRATVLARYPGLAATRLAGRVQTALA